MIHWSKLQTLGDRKFCNKMVVQKQQKQSGVSLIIQLMIKLQKSQKNCHGIVSSKWIGQLQMKQIILDLIDKH